MNTGLSILIEELIIKCIKVNYERHFTEKEIKLLKQLVSHTEVK